MMESTDVLRNLLDSVINTDDDFIYMIMVRSEEYGIVDLMIEYIRSLEQPNISDITLHMYRLMRERGW